jgi:ligand-binding sensor domain-containing protein
VGAAHETVLTYPTYLIDTWETEDGLPENSATAMAQTPDGYLWFGTFNGLVRFNGVTFTVFDPANTPQLPSASIVNLHSDGSGRLWVSTLGGLAVREGEQWHTLGSNDGWPSDYVRTFSERGNGDLLITTFHGQVFEFVGGRLTELPPPPGKSGMGYHGCVDEAGHWWVAQFQFIGLWDGQRWRQTVASTTTNADTVGCTTARDGGVWLLVETELRKYRHGVEVSRVRLPEVPGGLWSMSEDRRGNVWISTYRQGVCQVSADGRMRRWTTTNGLFSSSTRFVFEDHEGNLWVGTGGGGLARFKPRRFQSFGVESGLAEAAVNSLWPSRDGGLWLSTQGKGLFRLHDGGVTKVPLPVGVNYAQSVLTDRKGRLWLGTSRDLWVSVKEDFRWIRSEQLSGADIRALFEDSRGRIWIGGVAIASVLDGASLRVFTAADGLQADGARYFAEDSRGVIWLSTDNGVFRWENDRFVELLDNGQPLRNITCLKADAEGTLWMGSRDKGLLCWRDGRLARIASLPIRAVHGILEDADGFF